MEGDQMISIVESSHICYHMQENPTEGFAFGKVLQCYVDVFVL